MHSQALETTARRLHDPVAPPMPEITKMGSGHKRIAQTAGEFNRRAEINRCAAHLNSSAYAAARSIVLLWIPIVPPGLGVAGDVALMSSLIRHGGRMHLQSDGQHYAASAVRLCPSFRSTDACPIRSARPHIRVEMRLGSTRIITLRPDGCGSESFLCQL